MDEATIAVKHREKSLLVCFAGIDGAGKTTNAKRLVDWMNKRGIDAEYVWNRFDPQLVKPAVMIGRALYFQGKNMFRDYKEFSYTKKSVVQRRIIATLYQYFLIFEYILHTFIKLWPKLMLGKCIVCDRYVYDIIVLLAVDLGYSKDRTIVLLRNVMRFLPKPDIVFLIDLPEYLAYSRKRDIPSLDFLRERRKVYLSIGEICGMTILDGSKDLVELESQIQDRVKRLMD